MGRFPPAFSHQIRRSPAATSPRGAIGFWMTVSLVVGNMIGSGIFLLPASLAPYGGLSLVGWVISGGGALLLALVFARLARLDPAAGGPYAYTRRAFGDLPAFLVAWGYWISVWSSLGALAVTFVGYVGSVLPRLAGTPAAAALTAVATLWLLIAVNLVGLRTAAWVQVVTTILKTLPLVAIGVAGIAAFEPSHFALPQTDFRAIAAGVPAVVTLTLWAFLGLESATVPSAGITDAARTIPRATVVGTILAGVVYIASTIGVMSLITPGDLARSTAPFADAARPFGGQAAATVIALGAAISCFGALNGWVLIVGQLPLAVARDGLFPEIFARVSRRGVPVAGTIIAGVLTTALIAANYTRGLVDLFTFIILLSTLNTLLPYVFCSLAVFMPSAGPPDRPATGNAIDLATRRQDHVSAGLRIVAGLAFAYSLWAIGGAGAETVYWGFLLLICGLPVYVLRRVRSL